MKKQNKKKLFVVLGMSYLLALGTPLHTNAAVLDNTNGGIELQYVNLRSVYGDLSISGKNAQCSGSASVQSGKKCNLTVTLQRKGSSGWVNVKSWSMSASKNCSIDKTYTLSTKGSYRVKATAKSETESKTVYSKTKTY